MNPVQSSERTGRRKLQMCQTCRGFDSGQIHDFTGLHNKERLR